MPIDARPIFALLAVACVEVTLQPTDKATPTEPSPSEATPTTTTPPDLLDTASSTSPDTGGSTGTIVTSSVPVVFLDGPTSAAYAGPDCLPTGVQTQLPVSARQLAVLPDGRWFLVESQGGGFFDPVTGDYAEISGVDWSWTMSAAWDDATGRVLVIDLGGEGFLYAIDPVTAQVDVLHTMDNFDTTAMVYNPQQDAVFLAEVIRNGRALRSLQRLDPAGGPLASLSLSGDPIEGADQVDFGGLIQMRFVGGNLVVLQHPREQWSNTQVFTVDPTTGAVTAGATCP